MWLSDTLLNRNHDQNYGHANGASLCAPLGELSHAVRKAEGKALEESRTLEQFLASVEKRALQIARIAVRDTEDALDIVQDAMLQLARRYSQRPREQWPPLFFRILQNRIQDCRRRRMVRGKFFGWLPTVAKDDEAAGDPYEATRDETSGPAAQVMTGQAMQQLEQALHDLPARQLQAFMLRNMEGMDVAQTAQAMGCSEGSVKTHYSRAVHALRERLHDSWDSDREDYQ